MGRDGRATCDAAPARVLRVVSRQGVADAIEIVQNASGAAVGLATVALLAQPLRSRPTRGAR